MVQKCNGINMRVTTMQLKFCYFCVLNMQGTVKMRKALIYGKTQLRKYNLERHLPALLFQTYELEEGMIWLHLMTHN